jgi:hypothetical protein
MNQRLGRLAMNRTIAAGVFSAAALLAPAVLALDLVGSEELGQLTQQVISNCSSAGGLTAKGGGNEAGELAMLGSQQIAPLSSRFLERTTCDGPDPEEADGLLLALDAVVAVVDSDSSQGSCSALGSSASIAVSERNGVPGLQCPGCVDGSYTLGGFRDLLRIVYAGLPEAAGADMAQRDCNSDLRHSIAAGYLALFEGCAGASCSELRHAFRPGESADSSEVLLSLLGLPPSLSAPFCNADGTQANPPYAPDYQDKDPIRRPCAGTGNLPGPPTGTLGGSPSVEATEQVCSASGDLGLVLPISPPKQRSPEAPTPYPSGYCAKGKFKFAPAAKQATDSSVFPPKPRFERCPNGDLSVLGGQCLVPTALDGSALCINGKNNAPSFRFDAGAPAVVDGRVYNLHLRRDSTGNYATDSQNRQVVGAFHRLHATRSLNSSAATGTCSDADGAKAIGCLAQASPCSLGMAAKRAGQYIGTKNLALGGIEPSAQNVQRLLTEPADPLTYPLSLKMYAASMRGMDKITELSQWSLGQCFENQGKVESAATVTGYVPLGVPPVCVDFDERQCGALFNSDACTDGVNVCPNFGVFSVAPLQTNVGGQIGVAATASDPDGGFVLFLWTAPAGTFANPEASSTTYSCTALGTHTITLLINDGSCTKEKTVQVTCT